MLEMVRLVDEADQDEDEGAKSATAFFKIPKAARKKPAPAVQPGSAPRIGAPPVAGAFPGGPPPMPGGPPPIGGPPGGMIAGPIAGGPMAISGPTAGHAAGPAGAPFGGVAEPDHSSDIGRNRTRSFVTLAIVLAMVFMLLLSIAIAGGGLAYYLMNQEDKAEDVEDGDADAIELFVPAGTRDLPASEPM
jgi:hypothetical protein